MFGIPGQSPVTITKAAEARIANLMEAKDACGLRIGLKKGGCAGMEYFMEMAETAGPHDEAIEQGAARIIIAPEAQMFLFGLEIDYVEGLLDSGFRFTNPNVTEACGCGESVSFKIPGTRAQA